MKIDKDKFYKLKQLDRIEYRQRYNMINDPDVSLEVPFFGFLIIATIFGTIGKVSGYVPFLQATLLLIKVAAFILILHIALTIITWIIKIKLKSDLEEEYFSVEVKK
ncbi:hypothetical protein LCGC14_0652080 [marine sediment metagenome]|uniref:Uncharacterized protein n=1 Tax=marine sediment metagenome TaxID=412755 RepID=A0A0F9QVY3_9ZZZZ